jgi:MFS family permease
MTTRPTTPNVTPPTSDAATAPSGGPVPPLTWGNFNTYWLSQSVAQVAGQVLTVGFPLLAVEVVGLGPWQASVTTFLQFIPYLVVTPLAGWLVDRVPRLRLVQLCHLARAVLFLLVGVLFTQDMLPTGLFWATALLSGVLNSVASVGTMALVPDLAPPHGLVRANSRLQLSMSAAQVLGPVGAGLLVAFGGAAAFFGLAVVFGIAGVAILRTVALPLAPPSGREAWWRSVSQGFSFVWRDRLLHVLVVQMTTFNLFEQAVITLFTLFALNELGLGAGLVGLVLGAGAVGSLIGASVAARVPDDRAMPTMFASTALASVSPLFLSVVPDGDGRTTVVVSSIVFAFYGFGLTVFNVHSNAVRQRRAPREMQGRLAATFRMAAFSTIALGAGLGGLLAEVMPYRQAIALAATGLVLSCLVFGIRLARTTSTPSGPVG